MSVFQSLRASRRSKENWKGKMKTMEGDDGDGDETKCETNCKFVVFFYMNIYIDI